MERRPEEPGGVSTRIEGNGERRRAGHAAAGCCTGLQRSRVTKDGWRTNVLLLWTGSERSAGGAAAAGRAGLAEGRALVHLR